MAVTSHTYTKLAASLATGKVNFSTDTFKVMLLAAYTIGATQDTAQFVSDVLAVATEAGGTGYVAGGQTLTATSWTESGHVYTFTAANPSWASSSITASYALFYDATPGTNATNPVLGYWDFGGSVSTPSSGTYTLFISASGLLTLTGS